eukprot:Platyproteum_vivax@DN3799_c0_g1_i1.p1
MAEKKSDSTKKQKKTGGFGIIHVLLGVALAIFIFVWNFGIQDGQTFCANKFHRDSKNPPKWSMKNGKPVNTGGKSCIEDIVEFANSVRAGADDLVGTEDDTLNIDEHFALIESGIKAEWPNKYYTESPWFLNHNAAVVGAMTMFYADGNEYILRFGSPTPQGGYSGVYPYDCHDFQIEGEQHNWFLGNTTNNIYSPNYKHSNGKSKGHAMILPAGTQKGYYQKQGGWMLEYGYGNLVPPFYDGVILPTLGITNDWKSCRMCVWYFLKGVIMNNFGRFFA